MQKRNNYAFIDSQNLYLGIRACGWMLDYRRFRVYLKDRYSVERAFMFLGYMGTQEKLYTHLRACGFELIFKELAHDGEGKVKGNVDVDLTLYAMRYLNEYERAVIVTSDGDFAPLVAFLQDQGKFLRVLSPKHRLCSWLLRKQVGNKIDFLDSARDKLKKHP